MSRKIKCLKIKKYYKREFKKCKRELKETKTKNEMSWEESFKIITLATRMRYLKKILYLLKYKRKTRI